MDRSYEKNRNEIDIRLSYCNCYSLSVLNDGITQTLCSGNNWDHYICLPFSFVFVFIKLFSICAIETLLLILWFVSGFCFCRFKPKARGCYYKLKSSNPADESAPHRISTCCQLIRAVCCVKPENNATQTLLYNWDCLRVDSKAATASQATIQITPPEATSSAPAQTIVIQITPDT